MNPIVPSDFAILRRPDVSYIDESELLGKVIPRTYGGRQPIPAYR